MHLENIRRWKGLQKFSLWDPITSLCNFIFPILCSAVFVYSTTCLSSLIFFLGMIFSFFQSKVKTLWQPRHRSRYLVLSDPNIPLKFEQRAIFTQMLVLLVFFLIIKGTALVMDLFNLESLNRTNSSAYFMFKETEAFLKRLTPFVLTSVLQTRFDMILATIFLSIMLFLFLINWNRVPSANSFSLRISDLITGRVFTWVLTFTLSSLLIYNSSLDFQPSLASFIELFLLIFHSCRIFWAIHKNKHLPWLDAAVTFRNFFFFRILVFLVVLNVHVLSDSGLLMQKFLIFAPELKPDRPNFQLIQGRDFLSCVSYIYTTD